MTIAVAIVGANGRMGQLVTRLIDESPDFHVSAAIGSSDALEQALASDVIVDLTVPQVSPGIVDFAVRNKINVLVGTSGWSGDRITLLTHTLREFPEAGVIIIPNFSLGSVLATSFAVLAAKHFDSIEIVEAHHAAKVDSPSGTAVRTAELIGKARGERGPVLAPHADQRARGQQVASVPIHSLRLQGVLAQQDVILAGDGETLTISHETLSPASYEAGIMLALRAIVNARGLIVGLDSLIDLSS
jgi:4-hydroxy-tetrahydrodipicolinate reductase